MTVNHDVTGSSPVGGAKKNTHYQQLVLMTQGVHPFPYRTRKLSPVVPKIVVWRRAVKIGRCQHSIVSISLSNNLAAVAHSTRRVLLQLPFLFYNRVYHFFDCSPFKPAARSRHLGRLVHNNNSRANHYISNLVLEV